MTDSAAKKVTSSGAASKVRAAADRVLRLEAEGVEALRAALDGDLGAQVDRAVALIAATAGRVVVSGMGKSGHIGRKIAATMASVGTPALYVHPGEASHGDLGMITRDDLVLALSNSGQTEELADTIAYCSRFSIPLIGMTGRGDSTLAEASTVALVLPAVAEACPMGLAPTTSTTMMMALGDAMAVALLEQRGFSETDYQVLHPGGRLGRRLLRVSDLMHTGSQMPVARPDQPMSEVLLVMTACRQGCAGIVDGDGQLVGIITDGDLRRHVDNGLMEMSARDVMTEDPQSIRPEALAAEALGLMNARKITGLFAVQDGRPVGFLHMHDCLREGVA
jgi:arabinose-5-phosphate isomerase